ncbi:hypothetical protein BRAS3843_1750046 [Bradyrhizobium sp. STM 3843]|nr:hypothetical protein BRAS3843_1750046 [Bradyrhizobium sp. STM 3843]
MSYLKRSNARFITLSQRRGH